MANNINMHTIHHISYHNNILRLQGREGLVEALGVAIQERRQTAAVLGRTETMLAETMLLFSLSGAF